MNEHLVRQWEEFLVDRTDGGKLTQAGAWRRDNPGDMQKLQHYHDGGPRPVLNGPVGFGPIMLAGLDAMRGGGAFGADLWLGYEWAAQPAAGPVVNVTTTTDLRAAIGQPGVIVDGGNRMFELGGQLSLPAHSVLSEIRNAGLHGGRVRSAGGPWRLRNVLVDSPPTAEEDCVKGEGGAFLHLDRVNLRLAPRQGILLAPHSDVVISNSYIGPGGTDATKDHGIYAATGSRCLIFNSVFAKNRAYQLHFYPAYSDVRVVCCTLEGGLGSMLSGLTNATIIGCIFRDSSRYGLEQYKTISNVVVEYCMGESNAMGGYNLPGAVVRGWQNGGSPKGLIPQELWPFVPPTDFEGKPRVTADAGAFAVT